MRGKEYRNNSLEKNLTERNTLKENTSREHSWNPSKRKLELPKKRNNKIIKPAPNGGEIAFKKFKDDIAPYEITEIVNYNEVYYVGKLKSKLSALNDEERNHGWDNHKGFYQIKEHDHLLYRYEVLSTLGKGAFGTVYKCYDHKNNEDVAVKILRNKEKFHRQGKIEVDILKKLNNPTTYDAQFIVTMKSNFVFRSHICIVFEILSIDLFELIKSSNFAGFTLPLIKAFAHQLAIALNYAKLSSIVHCDLKPENILLITPKKSAIKVIDFGTGCFENDTYYTYIQSRYYRAPEIILGLKYGCPIDVWSYGCILVELFYGYPLFAGEDEAEQIAIIMEYLGVPPKSMLQVLL